MTEKEIITAIQHQTMRVAARASLEYHYLGIKRHFDSRNKSGHYPNMTGLICEAISYLNWLKRIWHYYHNVKKAESSLEYPALEVKFAPLVKWFANKWSNHRAVDYPKISDTDQLKMLSTQLDSAIMTDAQDGPIFPVVDDQGKSLVWAPLKEHSEIRKLVKDFIENVNSFLELQKS